MIDVLSVANRGYLETPFAIAVDGYLGALDDDDVFFPSTFTLLFGNTFTDTYVETFDT